MKIVADENISRTVVVWLRKEGHDVAWITEKHGQYTDEQVLRLARKEQRILLTHDKDFGDWIFRRRAPHAGVILLRFQRYEKGLYLAALGKLFCEHSDRLRNNFVIISENSFRFRKQI